MDRPVLMLNRFVPSRVGPGCCLALGLALLTALPTRADTRPVRRGPDLASRWQSAAAAIGSVEVYGAMTGEDGQPVTLDGVFGAGALSVGLGGDSRPSSWTTWVRLDGVEAEIEDRATGWILRRRLSEAKIPITEEGDLFGLLPATRRAQFLGENERGEQTWEYTVKDGVTYRVWLAAEPLRMIRRDVIRPGGFYRTTFLYREFYGLTPNLSVPRRIIIENEASERMLSIEIQRVASRPPVPRLAPLDNRLRGLYRAGEAIVADPAFQAVSRRAGESSLDTGEVRELFLRLDRLEDSHGLHPLVDSVRARLALASGDLGQAGAAVRAAASMGRGVLRVSALVAAAEYSSNGDSTFLEEILARALPRTRGGLTERDQAALTEVAAIAASAYRARGETGAARATLVRAWNLDPDNRDLAFLVVDAHLASGETVAAARAGRRLLREREGDLRSLLAVGDLLEGLGLHDEAESHYRRFAAVWPEEPVVPLRVIRSLVQRRRIVEAEDAIDDLVMRIERWDLEAERRAEVANEIAYMLAEAGASLYKARKLAEYALAVDAEDPYYLDTLGLVHLRAGNRMAAVMAFEKALARLDDPRIREHLNRARR